MGEFADWIIFYSDGKSIWTFSNLDGLPVDAPASYVQCISMVTPGIGWHLQSMVDYYVWDDRGDGARWWGVADLMGLGDYLNKTGQWQKILKGYSITSAQFNKVLKTARDDPRLPKKTAYLRDEQKHLSNYRDHE